MGLGDKPSPGERETNKKFDWDTLPVDGQLRIKTKNSEYFFKREPDRELEFDAKQAKKDFIVLSVVNKNGGSPQSFKVGSEFVVMPGVSIVQVNSPVLLIGLLDGVKFDVRLNQLSPVAEFEIVQ